MAAVGRVTPSARAVTGIGASEDLVDVHGGVAKKLGIARRRPVKHAGALLQWEWDGGGGGNWTHVREPSAAGVYADIRFILRLSRPSVLHPAGGPRGQPHLSRPSPEAKFRPSHQNMMPVPRPWWLDLADTGRCLGGQG